MWTKTKSGMYGKGLLGYIKKKQKRLTECLDISKGKHELKNVNVDAFSEPECECNTAESSDST